MSIDLSTLTPEVLAAIQAQLSGTATAQAAPAATPTPEEVALGLGRFQAPVISPAVQAVLQGAKRSGFLADVSFGDTEDIGAAPAGGALPEDLNYEAEIIKVELTESANGNEMLKLTLKVMFPETFVGRFIFDNVMTRMEGFAKQRCKSLFRACDLLSEDGLRITAANELDLKNNVVRFRVKNEEYQGKINPKVNGGYIAAFETPGLVTGA